MSKREHQCYDYLMRVLGQDYYVFPQVHLDELLEFPRRNLGMLRHINQKSVDFVVCDKQNISPLLAIELDDTSHFLLKREARDQEVESLFKEAGVHLLRLPRYNFYTPEQIREKVRGVERI